MTQGALQLDRCDIQHEISNLPLKRMLAHWIIENIPVGTTHITFVLIFHDEGEPHFFFYLPAMVVFTSL